MDYGEFGQNADEEAVYLRLGFPETWDRLFLKAKAIWQATYSKALIAGGKVCFGFQARAISDASSVDQSFATPPCYVEDTVLNVATSTEHRTIACDNIATGVPGTPYLVDLRITRKNAGIANNATGCVWLTGIMVQYRAGNQASEY
jgi:hypothetical protein